jgi:glycosyltransferase involved in cell wall biosynthesis
MRERFINGRFLSQRTTGVQRYARCIVDALDALLAAETGAERWTLLLPPGVEPPPLRAIGMRRVGWAGPGGLHGWEQVALPWAARGGLLVNLAGAAPAFAARAACVMHDAAVFDHPEAYTAAFVRWYRWLFRRLAHRARPPLTVSDFSRGRLAAVTGVEAARFVVVPGAGDHLASVAPDERWLATLGLDDRPFLVAVASANPTKNLAALLRAWAALGRSDAGLVVAGGTHEAVFAQAALPAVPGVLAIGPVVDGQLRALYGHARGLVFPSLYEGFGIPPLEAMSCGCPVAASSAASLPEVCGDAALAFDPRDDAALAAALQRLLDDDALRRALIERGRSRAARWRWAASARALRQALSDDEARP